MATVDRCNVPFTINGQTQTQHEQTRNAQVDKHMEKGREKKEKGNTDRQCKENKLYNETREQGPLID